MQSSRWAPVLQPKTSKTLFGRGLEDVYYLHLYYILLDQKVILHYFYILFE
jgi:hypothetical protein